MNTKEQLDRLYKIAEDIRIVQESGLWEPLHDSKWLIIKLIQNIEQHESNKQKRQAILKGK